MTLQGILAQPNTEVTHPSGGGQVSEGDSEEGEEEMEQEFDEDS